MASIILNYNLNMISKTCTTFNHKFLEHLDLLFLDETCKYVWEKYGPISPQLWIK